MSRSTVINYCLRLFTIIILQAFMFSAFAQNTGSLRGVVTDDNGEPLIGANVVLEGTMLGASTDYDGAYVVVDVPTGSYTVTASYVGYKSAASTATISAGSATDVNFTLGSDLLDLNAVVTTGVVNNKSKLESSVSISTLNPEFIDNVNAITTAELFRAIPGIRSEASGGEGNANIAVRGVPVASGGAKFLQLHEDGLPVLQFGDISFGNADIFLRADRTVARVEAIRGGSASTFASNSPAGIINLISKTGAVAGGSVSTTFGVNYNSHRTDFEYGSPIGNDMNFHIGGFFRQGNGPRDPGYIANYGGQIKANLTKNFNAGYARVYFKYLNDRSIGYLPMPIQATGTAGDPTYDSVEGFDARRGTIHSVAFLKMLSVDGSGNSRTSDIADGMRPESYSVGTELAFDLGEGWELSNRARMAFTSGSFRSPFPAQVADANTIAEDIGGAGYSLSYATGANAGTALSSSQISNLNGNGLLMRIHTFDTDMDNLDNFTNDFNITKSLDNVNLTFGYYKAYQRIGMTWLWQTYLTDVNSDGTRLLNITAADGTQLSQQGLVAHGVPFWGNCCTRGYDMRYGIDAPYANIDFEVNEKLNVDASVRYDIGDAFGYYLNNYQAPVDVDNNGEISAVEESVTVLNNANPAPVEYDFDYASFSIGANYQLNDDQAVFARASRGGRANADRLLYSPFITGEGSVIDGLSADEITQVELGLKMRTTNASFFVTGFYTDISEQNEEFGRAINKEFRSMGLETEAVVEFNDVNVRGGFTYSNAEITKSLNTAEEGNTPRRVPDLIFNLSPTYSNGQFSAGLTLIGTTKVFAQDDNNVVLPGYMYMNGFLQYNITRGLSVRANGNNIFNQLGLTEMEGDPFVDGQTNYLRARSITGSAFSLSMNYGF